MFLPMFGAPGQTVIIPFGPRFTRSRNSGFFMSLRSVGLGNMYCPGWTPISIMAPMKPFSSGRLFHSPLCNGETIQIRKLATQTITPETTIGSQSSFKRLMSDSIGVLLWVGTDWESGKCRVASGFQASMLQNEKVCARFTLKTSAVVLQELFELDEIPDLTPRYNIAPSQIIPAVVNDQGHREWRFFQWGLVPSWAKDPSIGQNLINAKAETAAEKPSFRSAFKRRRCLLPADGFYEWCT